MWPALQSAIGMGYVRVLAEPPATKEEDPWYYLDPPDYPVPDNYGRFAQTGGRTGGTAVLAAGIAEI